MGRYGADEAFTAPGYRPAQGFELCHNASQPPTAPLAVAAKRGCWFAGAFRWWRRATRVTFSESAIAEKRRAAATTGALAFSMTPTRAEPGTAKCPSSDEALHEHDEGRRRQAAREYRALNGDDIYDALRSI